MGMLKLKSNISDSGPQKYKPCEDRIKGPRTKQFASKKFHKKGGGGTEIQEVLIKFLSSSSKLTSQRQKIQIK